MSDQSPAAETPSDDQPLDAPDLYDFVARDYERNVANIVRDLRAVADRIERATTPQPNQKNPNFGNAASVIVADVMNMLPNLGLSGLVRAAAQADVALLHERAKTPL